MGIRNVFVMMAVVLALVAGLACGGDDNRAEKAETLDITGTAQARAAAAAAPAAAPAAEGSTRLTELRIERCQAPDSAIVCPKAVHALRP